MRRIFQRFVFFFFALCAGAAGDPKMDRLDSREEAMERIASTDPGDVTLAMKYFSGDRSLEVVDLYFARLFDVDLSNSDDLEIAQGLMIAISRIIENPPTIYTKFEPRGKPDLDLWMSWYEVNKGKIRVREREASDNLGIVKNRNERLYQIDLARLEWYKGEVTLDENGCIPYKMPATEKPKAAEEPEDREAGGPRDNPTGLGWMVSALCLSVVAVFVWVLVRARKKQG